MSSINKAILIGIVGKEPQIRTMPRGEKVANFSVATTERWKDKQTGKIREATEWHRVNVFGRLAEITAQCARKGVRVYVEGKLHTRKWQDPETDVERYMTEIRCSDVKFLGSCPQAASTTPPDEHDGVQL